MFLALLSACAQGSFSGSVPPNYEEAIECVFYQSTM